MRLTQEKCERHFQAEIGAIGIKKWCVPAAISYLQGISYSDACRALIPHLKRKRMRQELKAVYDSEWLPYFQFSLPHVRLFYSRWADKTHTSKLFSKYYSSLKRGTFIIVTTRHMFLLCNGLIYDNGKRGAAPHGLKGYWRCRVRWIFLVN